MGTGEGRRRFCSNQHCSQAAAVPSRAPATAKVRWSKLAKEPRAACRHPPGGQNYVSGMLRSLGGTAGRAVGCTGGQAYVPCNGRAENVKPLHTITSLTPAQRGDRGGVCQQGGKREGGTEEEEREARDREISRCGTG